MDMVRLQVSHCTNTSKELWIVEEEEEDYSEKEEEVYSEVDSVEFIPRCNKEDGDSDTMTINPGRALPKNIDARGETEAKKSRRVEDREGVVWTEATDNGLF